MELRRAGQLQRDGQSRFFISCSFVLKIYLAVEPCDMRMGFNVLTAAAIERLSEAFPPDAIFAFINKRHVVSKCFPP